MDTDMVQVCLILTGIGLLTIRAARRQRKPKLGNVPQLVREARRKERDHTAMRRAIEWHKRECPECRGDSTWKAGE